jgi:hypothetical protein
MTQQILRRTRLQLDAALVASRFPRHFGGVYIVARRAA